MARRPSFQFYPADWRNNANLRRCSHAARAVWVDVLCILHDSDEYGVLRWPLADIAAAASATVEVMLELVDKGVMKGADCGPLSFVYTPRHAGKDGDPVVLVAGDGPGWFSSRMVRDEWVRKRRGAATQFTSENQPPRAKPKPPIGERQGDGPSSSSSSSIAKASTDEDAKATANQLARLGALLNLPGNDFTKRAGDLRTLMALKRDGCDFALDILPAAQRAAQGGRSVRGLGYIVASSRESRDARKALASLPVPFEPTDEVGWRGRLRQWTDGKRWLPKWGPDPDQPDCKCPSELLARAEATDMAA